MKRLPPVSARNALIIFAILAGVFCIQMGWWIFFQVRNSENTRKYMVQAIDDERRWAVDMLNTHYSAIYMNALNAAGRFQNVPPGQTLILDPAVSGFMQESVTAKLNDSLYFSIPSGNNKYLVFLRQAYPRELIAKNSRLQFKCTVSGKLTRPDWVTLDMVQAKPATLDNLLIERNRHIKMFVMEGSFFLLLIAIGAYLIYLSLKRSRQIREEQLLFVHSITHELKIPITSISLFLDTIKRRNYDSTLVGNLAPKMKEDIIRLNQLIDNILQVRRLSDKEMDIQTETIDLSGELRHFVQHIKDRIESSGGKIQPDIDDGIKIKANMKELIKVWESLIDNSIKYAGVSNLVLTIKLKTRKDDAEMQFLDNGPGIPAGMEDKLFEPFFRGHIENRKSVPGSGLGLFIAREYIKRSGGYIAIKNAPTGGCQVSIRFRKVL